MSFPPNFTDVPLCFGCLPDDAAFTTSAAPNKSEPEGGEPAELQPENEAAEDAEKLSPESSPLNKPAAGKTPSLTQLMI